MPSNHRRAIAIGTATVVASAFAIVPAVAASAAIVPDPISYSADDAGLAIEPIGTFETGVFDESGAEIVAAYGNNLYVVNAQAGSVSILDYSDPTAITQVGTIESEGVANSVAVSPNGLGIIAFESTVKTDPGHLVFFYAGDGFPSALGSVEVGALPDMVKISDNGRYAVVANEAEPANDFSIDPEGSISIVTLPAVRRNIPKQADVRTADFHAYEAGGSKTLPDDVRVFGPKPHGDDLPVSRNLEPEYLAFDGARDIAYASLQEANAVAVIDLVSATVTDILPLGFKDHSVEGNGIDPSDRDPRDAPTFDIRTFENLHGVYMPDGINSYEADGETYLVTANEGDAREWGDYSEVSRVGDLQDDGFGPVCDDSPLADHLGDEELGRLNVTKELGFDAAAGCYTDLYAFGGRSFSIWTTDGTQVYDSGDSLEEVTHAANPAYFNSSHVTSSAENRSDDKGPEPENLSIGTVGNRTYAFIGLERVGGIAVYDITDPAAATFTTYVNNRDFSISVEDAADRSAALAQAGDLGPEGVTFIPANDLAGIPPMLAVANEVSGTTTVFSVESLRAPVNTSLPTISGSPDVNKTLTAKPGTWTPGVGGGAISYGYQWLLDGSPIDDARGPKFEVDLLDTGHELSVQVTARQADGGTSVATSAPVFLRYFSIAFATTQPTVAKTSTNVVVKVQIRPSNYPSDSNIPTGTVKVTVAGKSYTGTLSGTGFNIAIPVGKLPKGVHPIVVRYSGDTKVSPSTGAGVAIVR